MREYISVESDANRIRLRRSTFSGTFLLVEGSSDKSFYERFIDKSTCDLLVISGKPSSKYRIIEVLAILDKVFFKGVLAIVDADFEHIYGYVCNSPNLVRTDTHDLETMLLNSHALEKVIGEFGSEDKASKLNMNTDIRKILLDDGILIGYLRLISQIDNLNLKFDGIKFGKVMEKRTMKIDEMLLIEEIKKKSLAHSLDSKELQQKINSLKNSNHNPWQICCGHDLVEALSFRLRKEIGTSNFSDVEPNVLERSLRLAYEEVYFYQTQLYLSVQSWEDSNQAFKVLKKSP